MRAIDLQDILLKPSVPAGDEPYSDGECFDPWEMFPAVYGSYSSEFDRLAIDVLTDIEHGTRYRTDLAAEMFREMLCTAGMCDYGTSPRTCFATAPFKAVLPRLIERWREFTDLRWGK